MALGVLALVAIAFAFFHQRNRPSDTEQIERVLRYVATSGDPDSCEYATPAYLREVTGVARIYADGHCRTIVESSESADSITIARLRVDDDAASARVSAAGGTFGGSTYTVRLSKADGAWRLSRFVGFDRFDRASFRGAVRRHLLAQGWTAAETGCLVAAERRLSDAEVEALALHRPQNSLPPGAVACARGQLERSVLTALAGTSMSRLPARISCAKARLRSAAASALESIVADPVTYGRLILSCDPRAPFDFMRAELLAHEYLDSAGAGCVIEAARRLSREAAYRLAFENDRYGAIIDGCRSET